MTAADEAARAAMMAAAIDREREVIGGALCALQDVADIRQTGIGAGHFLDPTRRAIWAEIERQDDTGDVPAEADFVTIVSAVAARIKRPVDEVREELTECINAVPSASHGIEAARHLVDIADRRHLAAIAKAAATMAADPSNDDPFGAVDDALERLQEKRGGRSNLAAVDLVATFRRVIDAATRSDRTPRRYTGVGGIDVVAEGVEPGALVILAARPSVGKSTFALHLVRAYAARGGKVGMVSLEMTGDNLAAKLLSQSSGVSYSRIIKGRCSEGDVNRLVAAANEYTDQGIFLEAPNGANLSAFRAAARRLVRRRGATLLVVDYLGLLQDRTTGESEYEQLSAITRSLKQLARTLSVPIICLAQLNRSNEKDGRAPSLIDLRGSGTIEQDADAVFFLFRKNLEDHGRVSFLVAKNRNGPCGQCEYRLDLATSTVVEPPTFAHDISARAAAMFDTTGGAAANA